LNTTLRWAGREELALEAVLPMIGDGARALVARAFGEVHDLDALVARFSEAYTAKPCVHTTLLEGAREILSVRLPRAIITNKPRGLTLLVLEALGITADALYAGGDGPLKPAPDGISALCNKLGVKAGETWMIGDGPQDVLAGHAAGTFTVAVLGGIAAHERVLAAKPDLVVSSLSELTTKLPE
jgi:phosphoglycolate phosphatase